MKIKTRAQAIKDGDKLYFTGKPCKHGHVAERFIFGADRIRNIEYSVQTALRIVLKHL